MAVIYRLRFALALLGLALVPTITVSIVRSRSSSSNRSAEQVESTRRSREAYLNLSHIVAKYQHYNLPMYMLENTSTENTDTLTKTEYYCEVPDLVDTQDLILENRLLGFGSNGAIIRGLSQIHGPVAVKFQKDRSLPGELEAFLSEIETAKELGKDKIPFFLHIFGTVNDKDNGRFSATIPDVENNSVFKTFSFHKVGLISEILDGGPLLDYLWTANAIDIEGYLIQTLWIAVYSVVKYKKISTDMHCTNIMIRSDQIFQWKSGNTSGDTTGNSSHRITLVDYGSMVDVDIEDPKEIFDCLFSAILLSNTHIQVFSEVKEIHKVFSENPNSPYNRLLDEVLTAFKGSNLGKDFLYSHAEKAKKDRNLFRGRLENMIDFTIIKNLFEQAASILDTELPDLHVIFSV
jgi:hypothetical protein